MFKNPCKKVFLPNKTVFYKLILTLMLFGPILSNAQSKINSPYSRFGIGDVNGREFMYSQQMGGLGAAFTNPYSINIVNPAALAHLEVTSFDLGLEAKSFGLKDASDPDYTNLWSGNMSYMSLAVPLQNKLNDILERKQRPYSVTTAFTLLPYSVVGYDISVVDSTNVDLGTFVRNFSGSGGTFQFMWSNAVRYKDFSFGLNTSYLFGKLNYDKNFILTENPASYVTTFENSHRLNGFRWNAGLLYTLNFDKSEEKEGESDIDKKKMTFGVYGNGSSSINVSSRILETATQFVGLLEVRDTLGMLQEDVETSGTLPAELGFGVQYYHGQKFGIGVNYSQTSWSDFAADFVNNPLKNTSKLSIGGYYRPNYKSVTSYFSRVHYRFGLHYRSIPVEEIQQNQGEVVRDVGLNFGMGFPFFYQRKISHLNLGISAGMKGQGTAIEERYLRFTFSFTFNDDEWFIKRKYN